jgi:RNA polymerase primary sigma factor
MQKANGDHETTAEALAAHLDVGNRRATENRLAASADLSVLDSAQTTGRSLQLNDDGNDHVNLIQVYLHDIGRTPLLTAEQEMWLSIQVAAPAILDKWAKSQHEDSGNTHLHTYIVIFTELLTDWKGVILACVELGVPLPEPMRLITEADQIRSGWRTAQSSYLRHYLNDGNWGPMIEWADLAASLFSVFTILYVLPTSIRTRLSEHFRHNGGLPSTDTFAGWLDSTAAPLLWANNENMIAHLAEEAKAGLARANLRLVVSVAKRYVSQGMQLLDLVQDGNAGLLRAVEGFDHTKGYRFSTFATWWIRQGVSRAIADQARTIRVPVHMVEKIKQMTRAERGLVQRLGRQPTVEEVALKLDYLTSDEADKIESARVHDSPLDPMLYHKWRRAVDRIRNVARISQEPVSLNSPVNIDDGATELMEMIPDDHAIEPDEAVSGVLLRERVAAVLRLLTEREQVVLTKRFGLNDGKSHTLEEVGRQLGVTRERIRQIEAKAMRKLRHPRHASLLRDYVS